MKTQPNQDIQQHKLSMAKIICITILGLTIEIGMFFGKEALLNLGLIIFVMIISILWLID